MLFTPTLLPQTLRFFLIYILFLTTIKNVKEVIKLCYFDLFLLLKSEISPLPFK